MSSQATRVRLILLAALIMILISPLAVDAAGRDEGRARESLAFSGTTRGRLAATGFDPTFSMVGVLEGASLGLPGEPVMWVLTVTNAGTVAGADLQVFSTVRDEMRIDNAWMPGGTALVSGQTVLFAWPQLGPGETVEMRIQATVVQRPPNGLLVNQASFAGTGPQGTVSRSVTAEVLVPTGLPATGYAPTDLPGDGEPPAWSVGLIAFGAVVLTAVFVWQRGRRLA